MTNLLDDIGAELLNGQGTDVTQKLTYNGIAETVVIEIQNVLNDLWGVSF